MGIDPEDFTATIVSHMSLTGFGERSERVGGRIESWDKYAIDMHLNKKNIKFRYWQCM